MAITKKIYNAMGYRSGMPDDAGLYGCTKMQTCNRGYMGLDNNNVERAYIQPNWGGTTKTTLLTFDKSLPIYFDLENWLTSPSDPISILTQKLYAGTLLNQYRNLTNPSITSPLITLYGFPTQAVDPTSSTSRAIWKAKADAMMSGGELSDLIMNNIDALGPSFYPSEYKKNGNQYDSFSIQSTYNKLILDVFKANNRRNLPIYGWFQPRMQQVYNGLYNFLDYNTTYANVKWILDNCDGMVLFDWDGYNNTTVSWDTTRPWYKAVYNLVNQYNKDIDDVGGNFNISR